MSWQAAILRMLKQCHDAAINKRKLQFSISPQHNDGMRCAGMSWGLVSIPIAC
jgi:hypothetical protein